MLLTRTTRTKTITPNKRFLYGLPKQCLYFLPEPHGQGLLHPAPGFFYSLPQHCLYFLPEPQGQGLLRPAPGFFYSLPQHCLYFLPEPQERKLLRPTKDFSMAYRNNACTFCPNHMDKDYHTPPQDFSIAYRNTVCTFSRNKRAEIIAPSSFMTYCNTVCASYPNHKNENYYAQQKISLWLTATLFVLFTRTTWTRIITPRPRIFL